VPPATVTCANRHAFSRVSNSLANRSTRMPMLSIRSTFHAVLAIFSAAGLASCSDPTGPDVDRQSTPFYYYEDERIYLQVDPTQLTVVPAVAGDTNRVRQVLAGLGMTPEAVRPFGMENHWIVDLPAGITEARAEAAARALRLNEGMRFASAVYRVRGDSCSIYPMKRLVVQFRRGVDEGRIERLNTGLGVLNEEFTSWGPRLYDYPPEMAFTPLELAAHYHRQQIVEWAQPDVINGCIRNGP
jgi:hypothetical protein